jgi:hypothetical protein
MEENKTIYAAVIRATAEAFFAEVKRLGLTGGWDDEMIEQEAGQK